jgi:hypothetical protein
MHSFTSERGRSRYLNTSYVFYVQAYRDGWAISIEDEATEAIWKLYCSCEESAGGPTGGRHSNIVTWKVASPGAVELPGTGRYIGDLIRDFLMHYEKCSIERGSKIVILMH